MKIEQAKEMLGSSPFFAAALRELLNDPQYAGKRIILSSDDLTGDETDEELMGIVSIREALFG